jgi:polyhydroxyalkanoate synthesis regulator phasin
VIKDNFVKADVNKDGKLDNAELKGFLSECVKSAGLPKKDADKIENEGITTMWENLFQEDLEDKEKTNTLEEVMNKVNDKQNLLPECHPDAPKLYKDMTDGEFNSTME